MVRSAKPTRPTAAMHPPTFATVGPDHHIGSSDGSRAVRSHSHIRNPAKIRPAPTLVTTKKKRRTPSLIMERTLRRRQTVRQLERSACDCKRRLSWFPQATRLPPSPEERRLPGRGARPAAQEGIQNVAEAVPRAGVMGRPKLPSTSPGTNGDGTYARESAAEPREGLTVRLPITDT